MVGGEGMPREPGVASCKRQIMDSLEEEDEWILDEQ